MSEGLKSRNPALLLGFYGVSIYSHSFTSISHILFSVCFPIISGVFYSIFLCIILFIIARVAKNVAIKQKE